MGDRGKNRLAEVLTHERERFLRFVRRKLDELPALDAEDILSDVAYSLLRRADVVEQAENLTAYIYRSLANRVVDQHRRQVPTTPIDVAPEGEDDAPALSIPDDRPQPDRQMEQRELKARLHDALGQLSPRERAVWIATEIEEQTFRELAEECDEPMGTLLSLKSRANARLRTLLSDYRQGAGTKE
ncbi:MAG: sigma-70 family RNA polymerase sigma factor [Acidobacteriota bacterium]|nr:sigma-70 family RNA polymerase sigma factor [Acidobacteriota bacterium]